MASGRGKEESGQLPALNPRLSPRKLTAGAQQSAMVRRSPKKEPFRSNESANVVAKTTEARRRVLEVYEYEVTPHLRDKSVSESATEVFLPETEVAEEALTHLVQELVFLFIATFHQDSMSSWRILLESLLHIQPVCDRLQDYPQVEHYIRRVRYHASVRVEKAFMMRVLDIVAKLFPDVAGNNAMIENSNLRTRGVSESRRNLSSRSSALRAGLPSDQAVEITQKGLSPSKMPASPVKSPLYSTPNRITLNQGLPLTGKDAIEYFRQPQQSASCKIFYLVQKFPPQFNPYDVVAVPKAKVVQNPQPYFVVTKSEVVSVDEEGAGERLTHEEWLRDAERFHLLMKLPTFKLFLLREAFKRWRNYSAAVHEQRWKRDLTSNLLLASQPLVLPLQFMMRALSSISELQIIRLNADEDPTAYIEQKCLTLRPTLSRALMDVQSSLAMARTRVLASFDTYRKFRKHPALRRMKQSLYLSKEDSARKKQLLQLASKVERMHNLAFQQTASRVSELLEKSFTAAQHGPPFSCSLALQRGIDSSEIDLQERIFLEADLSRLREKMASVVQTLTRAVAETLVECEIRNKHNLMFGNEPRQILTPAGGPGSSPSNGSADTSFPPPAASSSSVALETTEVDLPECFTSYQSFMSRLAQQISGGHVVKRNLKLIDEKLDAATDYVNRFVEESTLKGLVMFLDESDADQFRKFISSDDSREIIDKISQWNFFLSSKLPDTFVTQPPVLIVSCRVVRDKLVHQLSVFMGRITETAKLFVVQKSIPLNRTLSDILQGLTWNEGSSWSEYIDFNYKYNESLDMTFLLRKEIELLETYFSVLCCLESQLPEDVDRIHRDIHHLWHNSIYALRRCKTYLETNRDQMLTGMEVAYKASLRELTDCLGDASQGIFTCPDVDAREVHNSFNQLSKRFDDGLDSCAKISKWKTDTPGVALKLPNTDALSQKFNARGDLWREYDHTKTMDAKWLSMNLTQELLTDVEFNVERWHSKADSLCLSLPENDAVLVAWQTIVDRWKKLIPLVKNILLSVKDENDWKMILNGLRSDDRSEESLITPSVGYLIGVGGFTVHGGFVDRTCHLLARRQIIEDAIEDVVRFWFASRFIATSNSESDLRRSSRSPRKRIRNGRDSHGQAQAANDDVVTVVGNLSTLLIRVDEDLLRLKSYQDLVFQELKVRLNVVLTFLSSLEQLLKFWFEYQSKFLLLQKYLPLLGSEDDSVLFVSSSYKAIINWISKHPFPICHIPVPKYFTKTSGDFSNWLEFHTSETQPRVCHLPGNYTLMAKLIWLSNEQDALISKIEGFLNQDSDNFPRLYLLSKPERRSFYCQAAESFFLVHHSPYLRRCFPAISKVSVTKDDFANAWSLRIHSEDEVLTIPEAPATAPTLSQWLSSLQLSTGRYIKRTVCREINELRDTSDFVRFVTSAMESESCPVQGVIVIGGLYWTDKINRSLETGKRQKLEELNLELSSAQNFLVEKTRETLANGDVRQCALKAEGLLYQVQYYSSVLLGLGDVSEDDFQWRSALQFVSLSNNGHVEDISVVVTDVVHEYGYSYVGPSVTSTFLTPLTKQASALLALRLRRGRNWTKISDRYSSFGRFIVENSAKILGRDCFHFAPCGQKNDLERFMNYMMAIMMDGSWLLFELANETFTEIDGSTVIETRLYTMLVSNGIIWLSFSIAFAFCLLKMLTEETDSLFGQLKHVSRCLEINESRCKNGDNRESTTVLDFNGRTLSVHKNFSFTLLSADGNFNLQKDTINKLRTVSICEPDWTLVLEAQLRTRGYTSDLPKVCQNLLKILSNFGSEIVPKISVLSHIRRFVNIAHRSLRELLNVQSDKNIEPVKTSTIQIEKTAIRRAAFSYFDETLSPKLTALLSEAFPSAEKDLNWKSDTDWLLKSRIKEALAEMRVEAKSTFVDKCAELFGKIMDNRLVLLTGPPASGKTLSCRVLIRALSNSEDETISSDTQSINLDQIYPGSLKLRDFENWLVQYKNTRWRWSRTENDNLPRKKDWLLLDGESIHLWFKSQCFQDFCADCSSYDRGCLLLEVNTCQIKGDPSVLENFAVVNFENSGLDWTSLVDGFLSQLPLQNPVSLSEVNEIRSWLYQLIPTAEKFVSMKDVGFKGNGFAVSDTNRAVFQFLKVYESVLKYFYHSETDDKRDHFVDKRTESSICGPLIYSLLWGFAGSIDFQCKSKRQQFEDRFRQCLRKCSPPLDAFLPDQEEVTNRSYSLFDYNLRPSSGQWQRFTNMLTLDGRGRLMSSNQQTVNSDYVGEGLTAGIRSIVSILRNNGTPTLLVGGNGVGKTALLKFLQNDEAEKKRTCHFLGVTSGTTAEDLRLAFLRKARPEENDSADDQEQQLSLIVDDLNLAGKASPLKGESDPMEWIRAILNGHGNSSLTLSSLPDVNYPIRLSRLLVRIHLPAPDTDLLTSCYGKALDYWLTPSTRGNALLAAFSVNQVLTEATLEFHEKLMKRFESPWKDFYSYHHVHRVFRKLLTVDVTADSSSTVSIPSVWCLVVDSVYGAMAQTDETRAALWKLIKEIASRKFVKTTSSRLYPFPNAATSVGRNASVYVTAGDNDESSTINVDFINVLEVTKKNYILIPDFNRTLLKGIASPDFISGGAMFLPTQKLVVSRLLQSLALPDGHVVLTSSDRWVGKETCCLGIGRLLACHTVTINYPSDQLEIQSLIEDEVLVEQCSNFLYWDNLWKRSTTRSRTATKSGKMLLSPLNGNRSQSGALPTLIPKPTSGKSGIPVYVGQIEASPVKSSGSSRWKQVQMKIKSEEKEKSSVVDKLQECLHKTGVKGDPVLLVVNFTSFNDYNEDGLRWLLDTVQSLIIHGDCGWLRVLRNTDNVLHYMQLLFLSDRERDSNFLYSRFVSRVRKNLRVLFCADNGSVADAFEKYPFLSHVNGTINMDSWSDRDWTQYAKYVSRDLQHQVDAVYVSFLTEVHDAIRSKLGCVVHPACLGRSLYWLGYFLNRPFLDRNDSWSQGLSELSGIRAALGELERQLDPLQERHRAVDTRLESCDDSIFACEQEYTMLQDHCTTFEEDLTRFKEQLREAQSETGKLLHDSLPIYEKALEQLLMLIPSRLQELKSYRKPPPAVNKVLGAFCLLFNMPQNFENAKQFIMVEYLPALLQQFNWEKVPEEVYFELRKLVDDPSLTLELVAQSSEAAAALWQWIRAVHNFLQIKYSHKELYGEMLESQALVKEKEEALKRDRSTLEAVENELNSRRQESRDLEYERSEITENVTSIQQRAEVYRQLLYAVRWAEDRWLAEAKRKEQPSAESWLLFVVSLVYSGLFNTEDTLLSQLDIKELLNKYQLNVSVKEEPLRETTDLFICNDVVAFLITEGIPSDAQTLSSLLALKLYLAKESHWKHVVLYDPYDCARKWTHLAWDLISRDTDPEGNGELNLVTFSGDDPSLVESLRKLERSPQTVVLIEDTEYLDSVTTRSLLNYCPNLTLLSTKLSITSFKQLGFPKTFWELPVIDVGCTRTKGLVEVLTYKLLQARHPNLFRQIRELEDLRSVRCQEAERTEAEVIASLEGNAWSLERLEEISKRQDQIAIRMSKLESDTEQELIPHREMARRIVVLARRVLPHLRRLAPGLNFSSNWVFSSACDTQYDEEFEAKNKSNPNAVTSQRHLWAVFRSLSVFVSPARLEDLIYQLSIEIARNDGSVTSLEAKALIDCHYNIQATSTKDKPSWISNQEWNRINSLEGIFNPDFVVGMKKSLASEGGDNLWKAYREEPFSETTFPPLKMSQPLSFTQNALLKSALCSKQLSEIRWALASSFMGPIAEYCQTRLLPNPIRPNIMSFIRDPSIIAIFVYTEENSDEGGISLDHIVSLQRDADVMIFSCKSGKKWTLALVSAINKATLEGLWLIIEQPQRISWTSTLAWTLRMAVNISKPDFKLWFLMNMDHSIPSFPAFMDVYPKIMFS